MACTLAESLNDPIFEADLQAEQYAYRADRSALDALSIESSDSFVASAAASIATGWSEPVPGRELHPLKSSAFHGALFCQQRADSSRRDAWVEPISPNLKTYLISTQALVLES